MRRTVLTMGAVMALVAGACAGDEGQTTTPTASPTGATVGTSPSPPATPCVDLTAGPLFELTALDFRFQPDCIMALSTQGVGIANSGTVRHTFTIPDTGIDIVVDPGQSFTGGATGLDPGQYSVVCRFHEGQGMVMELRVA